MAEIIETKNAEIESTMLGVEDHGVLIFSIGLNFGGLTQCAGGYCLDAPVKNANGAFLRREGTAAGMELIAELMRVVGVSKWEDLKGRHVRVKGSWAKVHAIGHFLKDEWLDFEEFFAARKKTAVDFGL